VTCGFARFPEPYGVRRRSGAAFDDLVAGCGAVAFDVEHPVVKVDLGSAQPAHLAAA
jgi:hypothetical protein